MRQRSTPPPKGSFHPPNDTTTYRDVLLFEERLKTTAASLQRRKSRYQLFLLQLLLVIVFFLSEVLMPPSSSLLAIPYKMALRRILPKVYTVETEVVLHPYFASGLLLVSVTTLLLFFASGMYTEKIAYANKYVPHANRSLRSLNMFLNVRKPPLRIYNPLSFFFPRPTPPESPSTTSSRPGSPTRSSDSSNDSSTLRPIRSSGPVSLPIHSIPPAVNPRGELIFSSRVDKNFRDSYERYRAAFERKREEREQLARSKTWWGRTMRVLRFWDRTSLAGSGAGATIGNSGGIESASGGNAPGGPMRTVSGSSSSSRGKGGSRSGTPPSVGSGNSSGGAIMMKQRSESPMRKTIRSTSTRDSRDSGLLSPSGSSEKTTRKGSRSSLRDRASGGGGGGGEPDMRTMALERSLLDQQTQRAVTPP